MSNANVDNYAKAVEDAFIQNTEKIMAMMENFHPSMIEEYNALKKSVLESAVNLIKLGANYHICGESVILDVNGQNYEIELKDLKSVTGDDYDLLFYEEPETPVDVPVQATEHKTSDDGFYSETVYQGEDTDNYEDLHFPMDDEDTELVDDGMYKSIRLAIRDGLKPYAKAIQKIDNDMKSMRANTMTGMLMARVYILEKERDEAMQEKKNIEEKIREVDARYKAEIAQMGEQNEQSQQEVAMCYEEIDRLEKQAKGLAGVEDRLHDLQKEKTSLEGQVANLSIKVKDLNYEIEKLRASSESILDNLRREQEMRRNEEEVHRAVCADYQQKISDAENANKTLLEEKQSLEQDRDAMAVKYEEKISSLQDENARLVQNEEEQAKNAESKAASLQQEKEAALYELRKNLAKEKEEEFQVLREKMEIKKQAELETQRTELEEQKKIAVENAIARATAQASADEKDRADIRIRELERAVRNAESTAQASADEKDRANNRINELEQAVQRANEDARRANESAEESKRRAKEDENRLDGLVSTLRDEKQKLQDEYDRFRDEADEKVRKLQKEADNAKNSRKDVDEKTKKLDEANKQIRDLQTEKSNLKKQMEKLKAEKLDLESQISDIPALKKAAIAAKKEKEDFTIQVNGQIEELTKLAYFDSKTETLNLNAFNRDMHNINKDTTILAMIGIDGMRQINAQNGRGAGDMLIHFVAGQLVSVFSIDCVYRILGDQFVVLVQDAGYRKVTDKLQVFQKTMAEQFAMVSFGVADGNRCRDAQEMIDRAESEMMKHKRSNTPVVDDTSQGVPIQDADDEEEEDDDIPARVTPVVVDDDEDDDDDDRPTMVISNVDDDDDDDDVSMSAAVIDDDDDDDDDMEEENQDEWIAQYTSTHGGI